VAAPVSATAEQARPRAGWDGLGVSVGEVLDRLAAQRRPPGGGAPFTLAGVLNLVAYVPGDGELAEMRGVIEGLADHQPSRAILVAESDEGQGIDATVSTSCRLAGEDVSVAVELVTLTLRGPAREGAASAVLPLLRSDLPTVLWWPGAPDASPGGALERLSGLADRVVTEAGRCADPAAGLRALAAWVPAQEGAVTDLAWAAVTPWRRLIAQMLDPGSLAALRSASSAAIIAHSAPHPDAETLLMAGWLRDLLGARLMVETHPRPGPDHGLLAVELEGSLAGRRLTVQRIPGRDAAAVRVAEAGVASRLRTLPLPALDRARLLAGELDLQRRDPTFERALGAVA